MLLLGSPQALEKFQKGSKSGALVLGTDFKVIALSDLGLGSTENAGNLWSTDAVSLSLADGLMVDWSLVGKAPQSARQAVLCSLATCWQYCHMISAAHCSEFSGA